MCVIIHKPKNAIVSQETLTKCWSANPHGAGFMYASNGFLKVVKGLMTLDSFLQAYKEHELAEKEVVIHFRLASAGEVVPGLTHPFWVFDDGEKEQDLAFVHNGHMFEYDVGGLKQSDTVVFRNEMLAKLPHDFLHNDAIVELLDSYLDGSIMVFMDNLGNVSVLGNTDSAVMLDGVKFSNEFWRDEYSESTMDDEDMSTARKDFEHAIYKEVDKEPL